MKQIRAIAFDLDGTLLNSRKQITPRTLNALRRAVEKGIEIIPATGRLPKILPEQLTDPELVHYAIAINGAIALDIRSGEALCRAEIPCATAIDVIGRLKNLPLIYDCFVDNWGCMDRAMWEKSADYAADPFTARMVKELRTPVDDLTEHLKSMNRNVQRIQILCNEEDLRLGLMERLSRECPELAIASSLVNNIEITDAHANKGETLCAVAAELGIPMSQVVAFGDSLNDLTMIRCAGIGVAMGNASPVIRESATEMTATCDEDGVALWIERYLSE